jgi:hypothetical protein
MHPTQTDRSETNFTRGLPVREEGAAVPPLPTSSYRRKPLAATMAR